MGPEDVDRIADLLLGARARRRRVPTPEAGSLREDDLAYAVQEAVLRSIGPIGGWKVGAASPEAAPLCAPLPRSAILPSPARLPAAGFHVLGLEAEIAFRFDRDLPPREREYGRDEVEESIGAALPVIEVVDSRWEGWPAIPPIWQLADLQSHGALVTGPEAPDWRTLDLRHYTASIAVEGRTLAETVGGNKGGDLLRLVTWAANHAGKRGFGLKRGDIVTTGSCTGLEVATPGATVEASFRGLGDVEIVFPRGN